MISNTKKIFAGLMISTVIISSCSKPLYNCLWQSNPVTADGNAAEWPVPLSYYDGDSKLQYSVSNDLSNIYVCIKTADELTQRKIVRTGLQVWIDSTGKNKHQTGILFPAGNDEGKEAESSGEKRGQNKTHDVGSLKRKFSNASKEMFLTGFKPPLGGLTSFDKNNSISVNINWDSVNTMVYEAVIPFKTFYKTTLSLSDSAKIFGLSFSVNGLPGKPEGSGDGSHGGGSGGGGMPGGGMGGGGMGGGGMGGGGMRGGGGRGGGMHGGGGSASNPMYESHTVKTKIQLAVKEKPKRTPGPGVW